MTIRKSLTDSIMKFLLDKNILSNKLQRNETNRKDLYVIQDVVDEFELSTFEAAKLKSSGVNILNVSKKHLEKLKDVLTHHGDNLKLINLYRCKGGADVVMLAYVLAEMEQTDCLFPEEYTIVTKDTEVISVAKSYAIPCISELV